MSTDGGWITIPAAAKTGVIFLRLREQLDEEKTIVDCVGDGYDSVKIDGVSKHILGYLQDFLFAPERSRTQVSHNVLAAFRF